MRINTRLLVFFITLLLSYIIRAAIPINNGFATTEKSLYNKMSKVVLKNNMPFSEQINKANSIYVIQYDFDLDCDVAIPANCVLMFEGGSINDDGTHSLIGLNTAIKAELVHIFSAGITLAGSWNVDNFDIRWFGVKPGDNTVDCTKIINNIKNCNLPIYFPKGTYYLSEFYYQNKKGDSFAIIGEDPYGLAAKVNFMPFSPFQRYIIKIGGGADTLGGNGKGYDIKIMHINFTTPYGYNPSKLTNSYTATVGDYLNGGLILDAIEIGQFAISGSGIHNMPFLTIGFIYECEFDYLICYGNHGKSIQPAIQIVNNQNKPYSALHVKKMMGEVIVGPMIKTVGRCAGSELVIDIFYFEGTINWERESIKSENRYSEALRLSDYGVVPIFDLEGCGFTIINAVLNSTDTKWSNSLDGNHRRHVRGLFNFNNTSSGVNILNLQNNGGSNWMYITGSASKIYPINVVIDKSNCCFQTDTRYINLIVDEKLIIDEGKSIPLKSNCLYEDGLLNDITIPFFIKNVGTSSYIQQLKNDRKEVIVLPNSYMFNEYGFFIDKNMSCIYFEYMISTSSNCFITLEYYDSSNNILSTENAKVLADKSVRERVVTINPPANATSFKLKYDKNNGYSLSVYKFGIFDCDNVPVRKVGSTRPVNSLLTPGFKFFDTTLNKPIYWTGNPLKGDNGWVDSNGNHPNKK